MNERKLVDNIKNRQIEREREKRMACLKLKLLWFDVATIAPEEYFYLFLLNCLLLLMTMMMMMIKFFYFIRVK